MRTRGLVVLAIVAVAMAVFIVVERSRRGGGGDEERSARTHLLPAFDRKTVKRITIWRKGSAFALLHLPSPAAPEPAPGWQLELDGAPPADDAVVDDLLSAVDLAESDRIAKVSPEQAGLVPPAAEIDIETPTNLLVLQLGRSDATGQGVYARAGKDGPIRVVGRRVFDLLDRDPAAFRDRRLFPIDPATVTAIEWRDGTGEGHLRAVDGRWQNGRKEWVASERVEESLRRLLGLRIEQFQAQVPGSTGLGGRTLMLATGATRITIEARQNDTLLRGNEWLRVPADAFESAWRTLPPAATRDDRLLSQPPDTVTRVDLHDDHGRVGLRRVGGAWTFSAPKVRYAADTRAVDGWLARLGAIKVATRSGGPNTRHLIVEGRFRQQADVSSPPEVHALLAPDPLRFRARDVLSFARFDLRRLRRTAATGTQQLTTEDGATWRAASGTPDVASASLAAGALSDLRAQEFVAAPPPGEPAVRWEVDVQPPGETKPARHTVQVWTRKDGGCVARLDAEATFTPEPAACAGLRVELLTTSG